MTVLKIKALFFGRLSESVSPIPVEVEVPEGATVAVVRRDLGTKFPQVEKLLLTCMMAVNAEFATDENRLSPGDEVAFLPPVSGG